MFRSRWSLKFLMISFATIYYLFLATLFLSDINIRQPPPPPQNHPYNKFLTNLVLKLDNNNSTLSKSALHAWILGFDLWTHLTIPTKPIIKRKNSLKLRRNLVNNNSINDNRSMTRNCPRALSFSKKLKFHTNPTSRAGAAMVRFPCGLRVGSRVTIVGKPRAGHVELVHVQQQEGGMMRDDFIVVSQFMLELRKVVDGSGEEKAKVFYFNPRIKGDQSGRSMIEMNSFYAGKWGTPVRCEGGGSSSNQEETVDGQLQCDNWIPAHHHLSKPTTNGDHGASNWSSYPFAEEKTFVLTLSGGLEGYHINVDGRHIASFAYRTGYDLEDATGLYIFGDIDVHSLHTTSLPTTHPRFTRAQRYIEKSPEWKAPPLLLQQQPNDNFTGGVSSSVIELFIGIISVGDHFAERMAVRKSWLQHHLIRSSSSKVVARFFVALQEMEEINEELVKEAAFFEDIVILPYLDSYDLVVFKTIAICEYGLNTLAANYIMKCDDDTFVRVDVVIEIAQKFGANGSSIYLGRMNYYNTPHRAGKWGVTFEDWAEEYYPPYADGGAYIISSNIARFIFSEFEKNKLRLFKMEDVSLGMWVQQFNSSKPVHYLHSSRFVQFGCIDDFITVHYQTPKQMACLWKKQKRHGTPTCCNLR